MSRPSSEHEAHTAAPSKSAYIKGVKATLESYLESNKARRLPNKSREKLFSQLITQLAAIENQQDLFSVVEILITTKSELLLASEVNNGFDKGDEHQGLSTNALDSAIQEINTALRFEKGMIYSPGYGEMAFTVPLFGEFMQRMMPTFES